KIQEAVLLSPDRNVYSFSSQLLALLTRVEFRDTSEIGKMAVAVAGRQLVSSVTSLFVQVPTRPAIELLIPNAISWPAADAVTESL
ncbi:unnamed protein product, partial [Amoebophrya sp. A120]